MAASSIAASGGDARCAFSSRLTMISSAREATDEYVSTVVGIVMVTCRSANTEGRLSRTE